MIISTVLALFLDKHVKLELLHELRHNMVQEMVQHVKEASKYGQSVGIYKLAFTTAMN